MKKILKYSTILGTAMALTYSVASADTGGYVRVKNLDTHFHKLGFNQTGCIREGTLEAGGGATTCKFASESADYTDGNSATKDPFKRDNELRWNEDDAFGVVAGADYGFFRLEIEGSYSDGQATSWRGHTATKGNVHQGRIFGNVVVEPFDLLETLGEFGGIEPLVKYNPAHYGISPYAMWGYGIMGGLVENLAYTRSAAGEMNTTATAEENAFAGGATAATNVGAGVNIGLDQLARGFSGISGATLPEYFKLPIELSVGYQWNIGMDKMLFDSINEDLGIFDGGFVYSVGLKW